jgi:hypothetical protein
MTTTARVRARTTPAAVSPRARRRGATIIRRIGQRRHARTGTHAAFVCERCDVAWSGAEADCWSCGRPASSEYPHYSSALQRLLNATHPAGRKHKEVAR